jgi:hypothetical protein
MSKNKHHPPATPNADKGVLGPAPSARATLGPAEGHQRQPWQNPARPGVVAGYGPLADAVRTHNTTTGAGQLAQMHTAVPPRVPGTLPEDTPTQLDYQLTTHPAPAAELTLQVPEAHRGNALYTNGHGQAPTVRVEQMRADMASSDFPQNLRAVPGGAGGLADPQYQGDYGTARTNPELPAHQTPQRPPGAVHHLEREPGELQHPSPDLTHEVPGGSWATRPPGEQPGPAGGFAGGRR